MHESPQTIEAKIDPKRVGLLYTQGTSAQVSSVLTILLYWFITKDYVDHHSLFLWMIITIGIAMGRIVFQSWFIRHFVKQGKPFEPKLWEQIFTIGAFLSGATWGVAGTWLLPHGALEQHAFLGFILAGNTAGAAVAYCTSIWAVEAFVLPATLPYTLAIIAEGNNFHYAMAIMVVSFIALLNVLAFRLNKSITESMSLHFVNEDLLNVLRNTQAKIAQTAKMVALGEVSGGVAHEINTPLSMIHLECEALREACKKKQLDEPTVTASADRTDSMVTRIAKIINSLRSFARESGAEPSNIVAATDIIETALDFCQGRIRSQGVTFTVDKVPANLYLRCHKSKLVQALLNLLTNALEAVARVPTGEIHLRVIEDGEFVKIAVADTGPGISKSIRGKIMQPFFTTKNIGDGAGLGLSVALGIVRSYEGNLDFETSDRGSTFTVTLPKAAA